MSLISFRVIQFIINFSLNLNIDYDFRNWTYIKTDIILLKNIILKKDCFDIEVEFTLINRIFLKEQTLDIFI